MMAEMVRIPFTFVVRSATWGPAGEAEPAAPGRQLSLGSNHIPFPIDAVVPAQPALDLLKQARRGGDEKQAAQTTATREAKAAQRESMPISPSASSLTAALYRNLSTSR